MSLSLVYLLSLGLLSAVATGSMYNIREKKEGEEIRYLTFS